MVKLERFVWRISPSEALCNRYCQRLVEIVQMRPRNGPSFELTLPVGVGGITKRRRILQKAAIRKKMGRKWTKK